MFSEMRTKVRERIVASICSEHQTHDPHCPRCVNLIFHGALRGSVDIVASPAEMRKRIAELEAERNEFVLRLANMKFAWEKLRDSPQATPDIKRVAEGFVGPRQE